MGSEASEGSWLKGAVQWGDSFTEAICPFGLGPHRCLGSGFAEVQIAVTLATIMHSVELVLDPPDYELQINPAPMPRPDKTFKFKVVRRR